MRRGGRRRNIRRISERDQVLNAVALNAVLERRYDKGTGLTRVLFAVNESPFHLKRM